MFATLSTAFNSVRDYFTEFYKTRLFEWKHYNRPNVSLEQVFNTLQTSDNARFFTELASANRSAIQPNDVDQYVLTLMQRNAIRNRPFQFYAPYLSHKPYPDNRLPAPGIEIVPYYFHPGNVIRPNPETSKQLNPDGVTDEFESYLPGDIDFGPPIDQQLISLIYRSFPQYMEAVTTYCRPAGTTDATFRDFNKEQIPSESPTPERRTRILSLVDHFMNITPYLPLHYVDTQYCKLPLVTGTGYHNRHSYSRRAYAHFSHPETYATKPTSKGYFYNATKYEGRTLIHNIKQYGYPFSTHSLNQQDIDNNLSHFFLSYPTMLFTRNHISRRDGTLKVRPVYAVDDNFIDAEVMLTFPATVQARKPSCCIMYGLETIRGSNVFLDSLAQQYSSFATIDWSGYDQRLPFVIVYIFFMYYLPSLIIISHGYAPTAEYPSYPEMSSEKMFNKMFNLLTFLMNWYFNMVFLSADGYAFRRTFAGVPSGLYLTQFLDSFGNLFLIIDGLIEFGCTDEEIKDLLLFIMGDDNSIFSHWPLSRLDAFITFLESYALKRWNMHLSKTKSVITKLRSESKLCPTNVISEIHVARSTNLSLSSVFLNMVSNHSSCLPAQLELLTHLVPKIVLSTNSATRYT